MEIEKVFRNTRIYDLNGDYEAILCRTGWKVNTPKREVPQTKRGESKDYEQNRAKTLQKGRSKIRRLIKCYKLNRFVTLTFAENEDDLKAADREFRKFMKRLQRQYPDFKYVGVREFQQRGAVHYHLAINTYLSHEELSKIWGQGFVWIERKPGKLDSLAQYLGKYITKHADDERLKGCHRYLCSHGLVLTKEDRYLNSIDELLELLNSRGKDFDSQQVIDFGDVVWVK